MPTTHMSSAPLLQVLVIRNFIFHSVDEAQCTDNAFVTMHRLFCGWTVVSLYMYTVLVPVYNILMERWGLLLGNGWEDISGV